ncbi:MAG: hypothetical protein SF123_13495 [Chloroflexota bacterium]|nr:hypothetical protein [Chloroflexota bacterium]
MLRWLLALSVMFVLVLPAAAQQETLPGNEIFYGQTMSGTITNEQFFELWTFEGVTDDAIEVRMTASGGLLPLIGLLDPSGTLVMRSDDGTLDGTVALTYTIPDNGTYTIVATRVGRDQGTTTGQYTISLNWTNPPAQNTSREVTFRCQEYEIGVALVLQLASEVVTDGIAQRITVYGLDGFQTMVRITSEEMNPNYCVRGNPDLIGDVVTLPGEAPVEMTEAMGFDLFELIIADPLPMGTITYTIGSVDSASGRYMIVLSGLSIDAPGEVEQIAARVGPLAAAAGDVRVYMIADDNANSRLDPYLRLLPDDQGCDDAGRRGCDSVPSLAGAGLRMVDGVEFMGDRFSAGVRLRQNELEAQFIELGSFSGNTSGRYALVIIGTFP